MKKIAIITARGGSKRIPRKNIKLFCGKPIIAYSIKAAINSQLFDEVMVSTDDDEIAKIAMELGASVPFMRSSATADDFSTTADVLIEVIAQYAQLGRHFEIICCLYPTAPFITSELLNKSLKKLLENNYDSLFPIVKYNVPIQIALKLNENSFIEMIQPKYATIRTQDIEPTFYDSGQFYWIHNPNFVHSKQILTKNTGAYIIEEIHSHDIDNLTDWEIAEFKYSFLKKKQLI